MCVCSGLSACRSCLLSRTLVGQLGASMASDSGESDADSVARRGSESGESSGLSPCALDGHFDEAWAVGSDPDALFHGVEGGVLPPPPMPMPMPPTPTPPMSMPPMPKPMPTPQQSHCASTPAAAEAGGAREANDVPVVLRSSWALSSSESDSDCGSNSSATCPPPMQRAASISRSRSPPCKPRFRPVVGDLARTLQQPEPIRGCEHWQLPLWRSLESERMQLPEEPAREFRHEMLCAGTCAEILGHKVLVVKLVGVDRLVSACICRFISVPGLSKHGHRLSALYSLLGISESLCPGPWLVSRTPPPPRCRHPDRRWA